MDISGAGTAIMLAIAAGLWFLYLVPTWVRQREYLATERTATRLQQTMRIMAETAEIPDTVRVAATAREASRQERILRARMKAESRRADAAVAHEMRLARSSVPSSPKGVSRGPREAAYRVAPTDTLLRQRMRRTRRVASLLMVAATIVGLLQIWAMTTGGAVLGSWLVLAVALAAGAVAIGTQRRLDARAMPRVAQATVSARARTTSAQRRVPSVPAAPAPWTPVPVPQPLYLSRPPAQRITPAPHAETLLRQAAVQAEEAARAARPPAEVVPLAPAARPAAVSRFAAMGVVDAASTEAPDLDEMLRRRRTAG